MTDINAIKVLSIALKDKTSFDLLNSKFDPQSFPKAFREFAEIFYELSKKRTVITKDVLKSCIESKRLPSESSISIEKVFNDCFEMTSESGEFNFYFEELRKQRAERILRDTISGLDEDDNPIKVKGKPLESIPDLIRKKEPYLAAKNLKKAIIEIDQLTQTDPIIRANMHDRWQDKIREYDERKVDKSKAIGVLTGFGPIDDMTRGVHPGEMLLVAGRPGCGKSQVLINIARKMFIDGRSILLFSLEMPHGQYEDRFVSSYTKLNARRMLLGALTTEEEVRLKQAWEKVGKSENQLEIIDFPQVNAFRLETELSRALDKFRPDVVIIDYLGIMKPNDKGSVADWEAQGAIAEEVRTVGRIYKVPIISAVQLNRSKDKSANTDRLSRSDIIGQTADVIAMINDKGEDNELSDLLKMTIIKNRKGESNLEFEMYKNFETTTIENIPTYKSTLEELLRGQAA
jgi:DNA polymerase III delta prime subunit